MKSSTGNRIDPLAAAVVFLSAFLLFWLEPLIAKMLLPMYGGTSAVWATCLVFFQLALLAGYAYADFVRRPWVHLLLLAASLLLLPIGRRWLFFSTDHPTAYLLLTLSSAIGLPFFAMSATTPLIQKWRAGTYGLFAVSNLASFAAMILFPAIFERIWDIRSQQAIWSAAYLLFVALCGAAIWKNRSDHVATASHARLQPMWFVLPGAASMLLVAMTNHISQNVAAVPLLWILPLGLYLLTFVIAFGNPRWYSRTLWMRILVMSLALVAMAIQNINLVLAIQISLPIYLLTLFAACLVCHAELSRLRPQTDSSRFYLAVSAGGAIGALLAGLIAPQIFNGIYELPIALVAVAASITYVLWRQSRFPVRLLWIAVTIGMSGLLIRIVHDFGKDAIAMRRSFYGALRVVQQPRITEDQTRTLLHGTITHGVEFLWPTKRMLPTTYYGPDSGIGILLRDCYASPKKVGIVGLGTGTIAAYGQPGDEYRYYEINTQVVDIAQGLFYFLRFSPAHINIETGDGRLLLQRDHNAKFDVLALDAFSGDAIPVHLLTREALQLYRQRLNPGGTIAFHVSNQYLDLSAVVKQLADEQNLPAVLVHNRPDQSQRVEAADWVLVTENHTVLDSEGIRAHQRTIASRAGKRPWTDEYSNLIQALKPLGQP